MAGGGAARSDALPFKAHRSILEAEIAQAEEELRRPVHGVLISGILAGLAIGTSLFALAVLHTIGRDLPDALLAILSASAFGIGFIIVILSRVDLFTEYTTIAILPVLVGRASLAQLGRLWGLVYAGNLIGTIAFAAFLAWLSRELGSFDAEALGRLAGTMTSHDGLTTTGSALLAGWLMGVLSWLIAAARDTVSQIAVTWMVAAVISIGGLHHAITGAAEVAAGIFAGEGYTVGDLGRFLLWTTLGNGLGGVLFAVLIRYSLVIREEADGDDDGASEASPRRGQESGRKR